MEINKIYNENCLDTMTRMPDNFIDLTVTSPPYDNLRTYNDNIDKSWGEHIWKPILKELYRVTKQGGVVVWVVGDATIKGSETGTSFKQALYAMECGFNLHDTMIYKKNGCPYPSKVRYNMVFEYMFIFSKKYLRSINLIADKKNKYSNQKMARKRGNRRTDGIVVPNSAFKNNKEIRVKSHGVRDNIWSYKVGYNNSTFDKIAFQHPAIFPEKLAHDHIISWSNENDLVYDPFTGSGTTAKMAKFNKRNYIGSEISKEYFDLAEKRINQMPKTLF